MPRLSPSVSVALVQQQVAEFLATSVGEESVKAWECRGRWVVLLLDVVPELREHDGRSKKDLCFTVHVVVMLSFLPMYLH